ncbi:MAG: aminotransferase class IV [Jatrophihabitans sp.]
MSAPSAPVLAVLGRGVVDAESAVARGDDAGLTRGDGCFEGCRLRVGPNGGVVDELDAHLARMRRSAAALEIDFDEDGWRAVVAAAVAAWPAPAEAAVKLVLTRGPLGGAPTGYAWITPLPGEIEQLRRGGLRVVALPRGLPSDAFAAAPWLLGGVKTLSYAVNMAAQREAVRRGAHDVLFLSSDGVVLEAPTSSVVWAVGRTLHTTPTGATGILAGTTQQLLFDRAAAAGWRTEYTTASLSDLHAADVVWLTSSVRGPIDVVELDGVARRRIPSVDAEIRRLCDF